MIYKKLDETLRDHRPPWLRQIHSPHRVTWLPAMPLVIMLRGLSWRWGLRQIITPTSVLIRQFCCSLTMWINECRSLVVKGWPQSFWICASPWPGHAMIEFFLIYSFKTRITTKIWDTEIMQMFNITKTQTIKPSWKKHALWCAYQADTVAWGRCYIN